MMTAARGGHGSIAGMCRYRLGRGGNRSGGVEGRSSAGINMLLQRLRHRSPRFWQALPLIRSLDRDSDDTSISDLARDIRLPTRGLKTSPKMLGNSLLAFRRLTVTTIQRFWI